MKTQVILVDNNDNPIGQMEKMEAHQKAVLHRAFSVFIFNSRGQMLLQKRAAGKYHGAGLWTNACCSHPAPGETDTLPSAVKRLKEEMGFETELAHAFNFTYKVPVENGLTEHEFDHVFIGYYDGAVAPDPEEVSEHAWMQTDMIRIGLKYHPEKYTRWFNIAFPMLEDYLAKIPAAYCQENE